MEYLAYIAFLFLGMQLLNVLLNGVFRQKINFPNAEIKESISVLIPARNEENNIGLLLSDLQKDKNSNIEVLVYDDESSDNTATIVQEYAKHDKRISLLKSKGLPKGWLGKNHACYQLAQKAKGHYFLFIDADVRIDEDVIARAVLYLKKYKLSLLSVFPTQIQKSFGERISVPIMNYILLTLLPLIFVRVSPFKSHAAANGQFMLFDAKMYKQNQPHQVFKNSAVEDIAIARFFKHQKLKMACLTGEKGIRCRMYQSYHEAVNGFSKNVFMFFGNKPLPAFLFWAFSGFGFIPVWVIMPHFLTYYLAILVIILMLYSWISIQNIFSNIFLFPLQLFFFTRILGNALMVKKNKTLKWKERNIYS